jgi:hypothetical protein
MIHHHDYNYHHHHLYSCVHYCSHTCSPVCPTPCIHSCTVHCVHNHHHTCTHTCTNCCPSPCTHTCNHPKPEPVNNTFPYSSSNLYRDIPEFEINFDTNSPEPSYSGDVFDIKKLKYPNLGYYLGYRKLNYISTIEDTERVIRPEKIFNTLGDNYIFIRINDWGSLDFFGSKIFGKVLLTSGMGNPKLDEYVSKEYKFKQPINIQKLDVELVDYLGNTVDMNGFEFSFTLELKQILNSNLKTDLENNFINYKTF